MATRTGNATALNETNARHRRTARAVASRAVIVLLAVALCRLVPVPVAHAETTPPSWLSAGLQIRSTAALCFDATTPGVLYTSERMGDTSGAPRATYVNDYRTGQRALVALRGFDICNTRTGSLFMLNTDGVTALRFSFREPVGRMVDHFPDYVAPSGAVLYAVGTALAADRDPYHDRSIFPANPGHLYVSTDDGLTWQERGAQFHGTIAQIAPVDGAPQSLYALVVTPVMDKGKAAGGVPYSLQFSADAGVTWEQRYTDMLVYSQVFGYSGTVSLLRIPGVATPQTTIGLRTSPPYLGPHGVTTFHLSADGGRTFAEAGSLLVGTTGLDSDSTFYATSAGIVRSSFSTGEGAVTLSTDGGATFAPLVLPVTPPAAYGGSRFSLIVAPDAPNLVLCYLSGRDASDLYLSSDGGQTWHPLASQPGTPSGASSVRYVVFTPTIPPTLLAVTDADVLALDLAGAGTALSAPPSVPPAPRMDGRPGTNFLRRLGDG